MKKEITIAAAIITLITGLIIIFGLKATEDIIESECSKLSLVLNTDTKTHNGVCLVKGWSRY